MIGWVQFAFTRVISGAKKLLCDFLQRAQEETIANDEKSKQNGSDTPAQNNYFRKRSWWKDKNGLQNLVADLKMYLFRGCTRWIKSFGKARGALLDGNFLNYFLVRAALIKLFIIHQYNNSKIILGERDSNEFFNMQNAKREEKHQT